MKKEMLLLVTAEKEIGPAVIVVVAPGACCECAGEFGRRAVCDARKFPTAVVVIKEAFLIAGVGHEEVNTTIVVVIAPGDALRIAAIQARRVGGDFGKSAISFVVKKRVES